MPISRRNFSATLLALGLALTGTSAYSATEESVTSESRASDEYPATEVGLNENIPAEENPAEENPVEEGLSEDHAESDAQHEPALTTMSIGSAPAPELYPTSGTINMRKGPTAGDSLILRLPKNATVNILKGTD